MQTGEIMPKQQKKSLFSFTSSFKKNKAGVS